MNHSSRLLAALAAILLVSLIKLSAQTTYVSSLGTAPTGSLTRQANQLVAGRFVTDTSAASFTLNQVSIDLQFPYGMNDFTVSIMNDSGANTPSTLLGTLTGPLSPTGSATYQYSTAGIALNANTSYWVTMGYTTGIGSDSYSITANNTGIDMTGPWTMSGNATYSGSWTYNGMGPGNLRMAIVATAIPEPSTYAMIAGLGALGLAVRRRRHASRLV